MPTLFVLALALLFIRVFPRLMSLLARLLGVLPFASPLLAVRQLARAWNQFTGPLLLITLTMGLACFTASMALTLDSGLHDQTYYDVAADIRLKELGDLRESGGSTATASGGGEAAMQPSSSALQVWTFAPVGDHVKAGGVKAATRLGTYDALVRLGQHQVKGKLLGIDRLDYLRTGYFRRDFAAQSLGGLVNELARSEDAVLVPVSFLAQFGLGVGDTFTLSAYRGMSQTDIPLTVAGIIKLFPSAYPDEGMIFVANLDYIFDQMQGEFPYDVLLKVAPGTDTGRMVSELRDYGFNVSAVTDARKLIVDARDRPERQGILGLLSVGALAAILLTVLGLLFYTFVSFRRRMIELGILRAIGLSVRQMLYSLGLEQVILIVSGVAAGTIFGVLSSYLFIPFLQVRGGAHAQIPPYVVQIAWDDMLQVYAIFGAMLLLHRDWAGLVPRPAAYCGSGEAWRVGVGGMDKLQAALAQVYGDSPDTARAQLHRYQEALSNFSVLAGHGPASVLRAPGRVNLIGEHTDYNHGYVLPIALDRDILMVARPRNDRCVNIWNMETDAFAERSFDLADQIPPYELGDWGNYVKASAQALFRLGNAGMHGMDALVAGAPPLGAPRAAGLSSSSALVVVAALAMMTHNDIRLQPVDMARLCSEAEWYVGTRGGIMDHFIAVLGERDRALLLDCRPVASDDAAQSHYHTEQIPIPPGHHLLICNSSVARQKTRSQYNVRVAECRLAVALLSRRFPAMTHLRDVQNSGNAAGSARTAHHEGRCC